MEIVQPTSHDDDTGYLDKATYDPANGAKQVAFTDEVASTYVSSFNGGYTKNNIVTYSDETGLFIQDTGVALSALWRNDGSSGTSTGAWTLGAYNFTVDTNTLFVDATNHRIGIGTLTPTARFEVAGTGAFGDSITLDRLTNGNGIRALSLIDTKGVLRIWRYAALDASLEMITGTNDDPANVANKRWDIFIANSTGTFNIRDRSGQAGTTRMTIDSAGFTGFGTITPLARVDIKGALAFDTAFASPPALSTTVVANEIWGRNSDISDFGFLRLSAGGGSTLGQKTAIDLMGYNATPGDNNQIRFYTSGALQATLDSAGNFGYGIATPRAKVEITTAVGEVERFSFVSDLRFYHSLMAGYAADPLTSYLALKINTGVANTQAEVMRILGNGNVVIGTTTSTSKFLVSDSKTDLVADYTSVKGSNTITATGAINSYTNRASYTLMYMAGTQNFTGENRAISGEAYNNGSGLVSNMTGLSFSAGIMSTGGVTNLKLASLSTYGTGAGTIGTVTGVNIGNLSAYNSPDVVYGINIVANTTAVGTSKYGLYIGNISGASTNNYSIYTGTAQSYFGGNVGIGATATSTFHNGGSLTVFYRAITALRTLDATDYFINCTTNTFSVTLPTAASIPGRTYVIKNSGTGIITVICTGAETIDGSATMTLSSQYQSITVVSNGTNWAII